jgi:hypothetical protein
MRGRAFIGTLAIMILVCLGEGCGKRAVGNRDYSKNSSIGIVLGKTSSSFGLTQTRLEGDGITEATKIKGQECQRMRPEKAWYDSYIYFKMDPSFKTGNRMNLKVTVEYFDATPCTFFVEFDGWDANAKKDGAYSRSEERVRLTGDQQWKTAEFTLKEGRFENRQNGGADVRLRVENSEFFVRSVTISKE